MSSMTSKMMAVGLMSLIGFPALAQNDQKVIDRVQSAGRVTQEIMHIPDDIPQGIIDKAYCVIVLPSVVKAAFIVGGSYGQGVMTCRQGPDFRGRWGAPTMMGLEGGSFGFQIGAQATDFVLLLMNADSARAILTSKVKLGADASAAAGPVGRNAAADTNITLQAAILTYSRARGLFAGVSLTGSTLHADNKANKQLYGKDVTAEQIVFHHAVPPPPAGRLLLSELDRRTPKRT